MKSPPALPPARPLLAPLRELLVRYPDDPAGVYEALVSAELWPAATPAPDLLCGECQGTGELRAHPLPYACHYCGASGAVSIDESLEGLVAVASLGPAAVTRAMELVEVAAARLQAWPEARVLRPRRILWTWRGSLTDPIRGWPREPQKGPWDDDGWNAGAWAQQFALAFDRMGSWEAAWAHLWSHPKGSYPPDPRPCPHEPLADLRAMGLALLRYGPDYAALHAPPLMNRELAGGG